MARECFLCRRSSKKVISRSHSNIATIRRQYVNLQHKWVAGKNLLVCVRCIKTMKKQAAPKKEAIVKK
ncbi:50S ribosomal protein L28 [Candidatus Uhrbacteria bacterium]|nr:50S ribosomal protein L28 [Candidatus Uhrbacteria bacterium]